MKTLILAAALCCLTAGCATAPADKGNDLSNQAYQAIQSENYDKAKALLNEALAENPKNAFAWLNLGVAHQKLEEYEEARKCYLKVVETAWDEKGANREADGRTLVKMARENLDKMPRQ